MKKLSSILSILIILVVIYWSFSDLKPSLTTEKPTLKTNFSLENALHHLKKINQKAHYVGTKEHKNVQNYIVAELQKLGLETEVQRQT
jgi:hypothetical protein